MNKKDVAYRIITEGLWDGVLSNASQIEEDYGRILNQLEVQVSLDSKLAFLSGIQIGIIMGMDMADQIMKEIQTQNPKPSAFDISTIFPLIPITKRRIAELRDTFMKERLE